MPSSCRPHAPIFLNKSPHHNIDIPRRPPRFQTLMKNSDETAMHDEPDVKAEVDLDASGEVSEDGGEVVAREVGVVHFGDWE